MAEALVVAGLVSAIVQFIDFGSKIIERLDEFKSNVDNVPKSFRDIEAEIPLLRDTLKRTKEEAEAQCYGEDSLQALLPVVEGCRSQVELLNDTLLKTLPNPGDRTWRRTKKAFQCVDQEKKVQQITTTIQRHVQILILHQVAGGSKLDSKPKPMAFWLVPFDRNAHFVGREKIFERLGKAFTVKGCSRPIAALCGLGGVGKSQIAIEFAFRWMEQYPASSVFWVYASNAARFEEAYKRIALECQVPGRDDPKSDLMQLVRNWLESRYECRWLMVIDNVDEASVFFKEKNSFGKSLSEYVPQSSKGSILYTTRDRDVGVDLTPDDRDPINVPSMSFEEARTLLGEKISCESTESEQLELLEGLDYLPLAITQAAAFIAKRQQTMVQYLNLYRHRDPTRIRLLSHKFTDHGREARPMESVATTWMISFECIKKQSPRAADILSLMSFLDQQDIPRSLLVGEKEDPLDFSEAIGMLDAMSLISTNRQRDSYKMHRLVQLATRAWLSECDNGVERLASQALEILAANFPNGGYEHWTTCAAYLPHAEAVLSHCFDESSGTNKTAWAALLLNTSRYFRGQGRFEAAEARAEKSFCLRKEMLGTEHPETLTCLSTLASVFQYRGKYEEAEKMGRQALKGREKTLGMEHPDTLTSISDLAFVLRHRGKYEEAEEMNRRALERRENTLGEEQLDTLASVSYLAEVLKNQGKYEDAGRMERRALEGRRNILGEEHPDTLISLSNLAEILTSQGEYGTAEEKHRRALKGREKTLGKEQPTTLISVSNLALLFQRRGKYEEAEKLSRRALEGRKKRLGKEHPGTLTSVKNLALVIRDRGNYEVAEEMIRRVVEGREKKLGKENPTTLTSISILADVLQDQGKYRESEEMNRRALEARERVLGNNHPDTLISIRGLASVLQYQGKYEEAEKLYRRALERGQKALGKEHPGTLTSLGRLAWILQKQSKYGEAEEMNRRALEWSEKALGEEHPDTLTCFNNLASVFRHQGRYKIAEEINRRALEGREKILGKEHPETLVSVTEQALILRHQGKYEEAEEVNRRALEGREKMLGEEHPDTLTSLNGLAAVLRHQGRYEEAEEINRRALKGREKMLGKEHPDTLISVSSLASVLQQQGRYEEAEEVNRRALEGKERVLGKEHSSTLTSVSNLALVLQHQGKYKEAEEMNRRALEARKRVLGSEHPDTLISVDNLASMLQDQGKYDTTEDTNRHLMLWAADAVVFWIAHAIEKAGGILNKFR